ncbi:MAG TPA: precorrin-8X methylmutase [Alphaproteobacteria bacterium]|nr:precorrin-8X methylmutase [Alphaproteobacteria bacterium]
MTEPWLRDAEAIYRLSFERARAATDLSMIPVELQDIALRLVHACARPEIVGDLTASVDAVKAGVAALRRGVTVIVDSRMTAAGITRAFLPAGVEVVCILDQPDVAERAAADATTRSAAAVDRMAARLSGSIVAIGNAPTALFRLLEIVSRDSAKCPALVLGFPVGFVGAAESKEALIASRLPHITLKGRFGGSPLVAAAVNALALKAKAP